MTALCQVGSSQADNLFAFATDDGRGIQKGLSFLFPFVGDKTSWPYEQDVLHWEEWPVRHPFLLFGGLATGTNSYIDLWKLLNGNFDTPEVVRNRPVPYPLLWLN